MKKTESAAQTIKALNPEVKVVQYDEMLTEDNVDRIIAGYDLVIDGTDTFETRYTLNDAAVRAAIPVVHAAVFRFEGQLTVFVPFEGPCYRCLYPTPPPPELAPGCSVAGVLGVVPGVMGLLQATEAVKVLLDLGDPLVGRLLIWDALDGTFCEVSLRRDPHCPACGDGALPRPARGAAASAPTSRQQGDAGTHPAGPAHSRRGSEGSRGGRVNARRGAARPDSPTRYGRAALDGRRRAPPFRQHLRERPGRPLPRAARDTSRRAGHGHHPVRRWPGGSEASRRRYSR